MPSAKRTIMNWTALLAPAWAMAASPQITGTRPALNLGAPAWTSSAIVSAMSIDPPWR
jgi:hypothetical protein